MKRNFLSSFLGRLGDLGGSSLASKTILFLIWEESAMADGGREREREIRAFEEDSENGKEGKQCK